MRATGIPSDIINWVRSYLTNRKQYAGIDGTCSGNLDAHSGGTPKICNRTGLRTGNRTAYHWYMSRYISVICLTLSTVLVKLFAGNCFIFKTINSISEQLKLNVNLKLVTEWCDKRDVIMNFEKTIYIYICFTNKRNKLEFSYNMNQNLVKQVRNVSILALQ